MFTRQHYNKPRQTSGLIFTKKLIQSKSGNHFNRKANRYQKALCPKTEYSVRIPKNEKGVWIS